MRVIGNQADDNNTRVVAIYQYSMQQGPSLRVILSRVKNYITLRSHSLTCN